MRHVQLKFVDIYCNSSCSKVSWICWKNSKKIAYMLVYDQKHRQLRFVHANCWTFNLFNIGFSHQNKGIKQSFMSFILTMTLLIYKAHSNINSIPRNVYLAIVTVLQTFPTRKNGVLWNLNKGNPRMIPPKLRRFRIFFFDFLLLLLCYYKCLLGWTYWWATVKIHRQWNCPETNEAAF